MNQLAWGAGAASVAIVVGLIVKHDRDEQQRYERLSKRLATIEEGVQGSGEGVSAPQFPTTRTCSLDSMDLDVIARMMREATSASTPRDRTPEAVEPLQRTPEQQAAVARAKTIVDGILNRRRITRDDAVELRRLLNATGSPADVEEIQRRIRVAINRDELVPDDPQLIP
ncbi:MAG: hypothetical protein M3O46_15965 [Myxococcota bacterium]|nr:hypothetical protein [Myxococcota bacterium]